MELQKKTGIKSIQIPNLTMQLIVSMLTIKWAMKIFKLTDISHGFYPWCDISAYIYVRSLAVFHMVLGNLLQVLVGNPIEYKTLI